jgi:hypothetical protein
MQNSPIAPKAQARAFGEFHKLMPLPKGYTIDDPLTPAQFGAWIGRCERWVRARLHKLPGVLRENRGTVLIWPRGYLEGRVKGAKR